MYFTLGRVRGTGECGGDTICTSASSFGELVREAVFCRLLCSAGRDLLRDLLRGLLRDLLRDLLRGLLRGRLDLLRSASYLDRCSPERRS